MRKWKLTSVVKNSGIRKIIAVDGPIPKSMEEVVAVEDVLEAAHGLLSRSRHKT